MALISEAVPNIWHGIVKEHEGMRPPFNNRNPACACEEYTPVKHTPVFCGYVHKRVSMNGLEKVANDPATTHPATAGYSLSTESLDSENKNTISPRKPDRLACTARDYLEFYVFPTLLPGLEEMLKQAEKERCFERCRTKFNAADFLTEYLYKNNPNHKDRDDVTFLDIPFVREYLSICPRPPIPKSLLWTEAEATLIIQSYFRGYKVRRAADVQELRNWQRDWREKNRDMKRAVEELWANMGGQDDECEGKEEDPCRQECDQGAPDDDPCHHECEASLQEEEFPSPCFSNDCLGGQASPTDMGQDNSFLMSNQRESAAPCCQCLQERGEHAPM